MKKSKLLLSIIMLLFFAVVFVVAGADLFIFLPFFFFIFFLIIVLSISKTNNKSVNFSSKANVGPYDSMFDLNEDQMLEEFINRELVKANISKNSKLISSDILKRKIILNIIFTILTFVYISMIFFHFPIVTYIIGIIILIVFFKITRNYDLMEYLKKQLKSRPSEKVSNIVMNVKNNFVSDKSTYIIIIGVCFAVVLPLFIFINPRIMYEKVDGGYAVRFYTFGLTNFKTATIPDTYKGEDVVGLRGNTFSNMPFLEEVILPDTITEIRGQAFKNDRRLVKVNIPSNLEYLGGGAFYNCTSITSIELPDSVTYIGGEAFFNAKSLKYIKLSDNITEIRGSTFENCSSLESITIPDSVTRIGGHAFYGNSSLSKVVFNSTSSLEEIGSSAFRMCKRLYNITLPNGVFINSRAFKESPTNIMRFGSIEYSNTIDTSKYLYEYFIIVYVNETENINAYKKDALTQNAYLSLVSIKEGEDSNIFTLKYSDSNGEKTFDLDDKNSYNIINSNVAVEISGKHVFQYDNRVTLNVYYN